MIGHLRWVLAQHSGRSGEALSLSPPRNDGGNFELAGKHLTFSDNSRLHYVLQADKEGPLLAVIFKHTSTVTPHFLWSRTINITSIRGCGVHPKPLIASEKASRGGVIIIIIIDVPLSF